ncbi:MAG: serine acetyltransferase [Leptospiraceae bacterium]|nr:serine acetyltransferase [Leptospiraceae bacterium]MCB1315524.1 serine acetyltransferase [Leptospiraceae bacterium]MCB1320242.1 serine acetyltransferase [Leptospiraceae bacterium]
MIEDLRAIKRNDPASRGMDFLLYPCLHALCVHRLIARPLYCMHMYFLARMFSQFARFLTGIEIHPGAQIGGGLFIDHGMGVVIGETSEIGINCVLFHGVTLGGTGKHRGKRHPMVGDDVLIGTNATLLGPIQIGSRSRIGAETVVINRDIPPDCTVVGTPGKIVKRSNRRVDPPESLPYSAYRELEIEDEERQFQSAHPAHSG